MSIDKTAYTILGYDISDYREQILTDEFRWSDPYEEITNREIRLFDGSQSRDDNFLFFGFPLFCSETWGEQSPNITAVHKIEEIQLKVDAEWWKWKDLFSDIDKQFLTFQIICFEEYS